MNLNFASDNAGPVHPAIMQALADANAGGTMPYGNDDATAALRDRFRTLLAWPEAEIALVATGTAANAIALAALVKPYDAILCHQAAHIQDDEAGAPEFYTGGAKLVPVPGPHGRIDPDALRAACARIGTSVHAVQRGALSLTDVTEAGTLYTPDQLDALTAIARDYGMATHLDGARFANACAALDCTAADLARGFDVVSFGGTKNGCMGVEAIVLRDPAGHWDVQMRRKRAGHLWSKHRYLAAQMTAYLADDLWLDLGGRANAAAGRLAEGLARAGAEVVHPPQANMIFARLDPAAHDRAKAAGAAYYVMDDAPRPLCRLVCDWSKTDAEVDALLRALAG
ncbi:threonine aldolase family protein [Jannaschia sp. LMIT008]|uniref:threonine aldolase family protein n=1 Tax=Jannaschia maritima TaxID=3032585 RepID=UPI002810E09F|nr:beta-eliminating lyase-related protein [Jannaschia sp. LMIT008]